MDALVDTAPTVTLTVPKQNVERPANGTLEVAGFANDDLGIKALALQPSQRYESAEALKADVERWLADEPVSAYAEPWSARLRRQDISSHVDPRRSESQCAVPKRSASPHPI